MEGAMKCHQERCTEVPTVRAHGPHGLFDYCAACASRYAAVMTMVGASVALMPILTVLEGSDAEG